MPIMTSSQAYWTQISSLAQRLSDGDEVITLGYLAGASKALFLASLSHHLQRPLFVVTSTAPEAELLVHDLHLFTTTVDPSTRIVLLPAEEHAPYEPASETSDLTTQRLLALRSMLHTDRQIIVTTPPAIVPYVMSRVLLQQAGLELAPGLTLDRQECLERLLRCGYHRVDLVEEWGDGSDSFGKDPPNATVSVLNNDATGVTDAVVVLTNPKLEGDKLTFAVEVLEGQLAGNGPAAVFIDIIGRPLTPVSYAGVARRTAYRSAWYGAGAAVAGAAVAGAAIGAAATAPYYPPPACGYYPYPPCY